MLKRAITGTFYVVAIVGSVYVGGWLLQFLFGVLVVLMLQEYSKMFQKKESKPNAILTPILGLILYSSAAYGIESGTHDIRAWTPLLALSLISFIWLALVELFKKSSTQPFANISLSIGGLCYIVLPLSLIIQMSHSDQEGVSHHIFPLLGIFIMIWCSDTFAYLIGKQIGKNKMFERISPNKTWEGFMGGMTFAILAGLVIAYFLDNQSYFSYAVMGALCAIFGTLGDLIESMLKRSLGLKDSGTILPGHGGLLDRLDSILVVIPVIFVFQLLQSYYFA
jgi:phosphatidate cytidylyltransferase